MVFLWLRPAYRRPRNTIVLSSHVEVSVAEGWLVCDACGCGYGARTAGDTCGDRSWIPQSWRPAIRFVCSGHLRRMVRLERRWTCPGQLWPEDMHRDRATIDAGTGLYPWQAAIAQQLQHTIDVMAARS